MAKLSFFNRAQNDEEKENEGQADAPAAQGSSSSPAKSIDSRSVYGGGRLAVRDDDEDTETLSNRIFINPNSTQTNRLLHCVNPRFFEKGSGKQYLMVAFKLPPAFLHDARFTIKNDGLSASLYLRLLYLCYNPCVLLGLDLDENHPFYQAVHKELIQISGRGDNRAKFKIGLKLPFKCECKTTGDIIGYGQHADALPVRLSAQAVVSRSTDATSGASSGATSGASSGTGTKTSASRSEQASIPQLKSPTNAVQTPNHFQMYKTDENGHKRLRARDNENNAEMKDEDLSL